MATRPASGEDWSDREIDLVVGDYFEMLGMELRSEPFVKVQRNAQLQLLIARSHGSIEFKHQNISAVLVKLGLPCVRGYKPMPNFQRALIKGVERYLDKRDGGFELIPLGQPMGFHEAPALIFEAPPIVTAATQSIPEPLNRLVRKFDPAARDANNRRLGRGGEELIFNVEQMHLRSAGREDLARKVRWISEEDGDGAGYDIRSFDASGRDRLIEVKTTAGDQMTPFYLSENERSFAEERLDVFRLIRVYDFARQPRAFELAPPLQNTLVLEPTNYRASFNG